MNYSRYLREFPENGYSALLVNQFADVVISHIESLPSDYYRMMREFTDNGNTLPPGEASIFALGFDFAEDYKKMLRPAELVEKYIGLDCSSLQYLLSGYEDPEIVGEIGGMPVLFLPASGQYYFDCGSTASGVLSISLTGAFYPPVLPNRELCAFRTGQSD